MTREIWLDRLTRLQPHAATDLDAPAGAPAPITNAPAGEPPAGAGPLPPSRLLWDTGDPRPRAAIGVRIAQPLADPLATALRLAAAAAERDVEPVILSALPMTGLEAYGFRVERLPADPAEARRCEAELSAFWDLAIVIDGSEIAALG